MLLLRPLDSLPSSLASRWRVAAERRSARPAGLALLGVLAAACSSSGQSDPLATRAERASAAAASPSATVAVELRTPSWPTYPCSQCHEHAKGQSNPTVRELRTFHTARNDIAHGSFTGWCYRCHLEQDVDQLALADGRPVSYAQSHEQCGSCHGEKLRDWREGIHGRTTGQWQGVRVRQSCVGCHDPHQPRFGDMVAEPAPAPPRTELRRPRGAS